MDQIKVLNSRLLSLVKDDYPIGLVTGKMGICIYYYYLSRWEECEEYKQIADDLLDNIICQLSDTTDVTVEAGLAGIAIGINHLVEEKFVDGNINEILEEVDNVIFKKLAFLIYKDVRKHIPKVDLIHLLYYLYIRYEGQTSSDNKFIYQELIIKTIEMLKEDLNADFFNKCFSFSLRDFYLPFFLCIVSKIYDLNIYNDRINKILEEYIIQILSIFPVSQANRLYLLCGLIYLKSCLPEYENRIESHIQLLKDNIDVDYIINEEFGNQEVYVVNGLSAVYILLFYLRKKTPIYSIDYDPQSFFARITTSNAWKVLLNRDFYFHRYTRLFDGFPGTYLVLLHIKNHFL